MKLALVAATLAALVLSSSALASSTSRREPALEVVASRISGQPVEVLCYERAEPDDPFEYYGAWGYVYLELPVVHLADEVCEGALALSTDDPLVDDWKKALGALVLTHEAYHLARRYADRGNEARTECRAIRHARYVMGFLGASPAVASRLMGWALALHWRLSAKFPEYSQKDCKVPNPY